MPDNKEKGLYGKYRVERVDQKPIGDCLVLEFKDPNTHRALAEYARTVRKDGYEQLANDVEKLLVSNGFNLHAYRLEKQTIRYGLERLSRMVEIDQDVSIEAKGILDGRNF